jgi:hypothetical protein
MQTRDRRAVLDCTSRSKRNVLKGICTTRWRCNKWRMTGTASAASPVNIHVERNCI